MSRILTGQTAVTLASIEADYAASTEAASLAYVAHEKAINALLDAAGTSDTVALVAAQNATGEAAGRAYRQQSEDRYRLAQYRIASRRGTREDYLCKRPR